jgi:hypothetical protein
MWLYIGFISKRRNVTIDPMNIENVINEYYEKFYAHKLDNLDESNKFLKSHSLQEVIHRKKQKL